MKHTIIHRKHFSLVELLVVIAVIAILAGIVLGAMDGINKKKDQAKTAGVIQEIGLALTKYYDEHGEYPTLTVAGNNSIIETNFNDTLGPYYSISSEFISGGYIVDTWEQGIQYIPNTSYSDTVGYKNSADIHYNPSTFQLISFGKDGSVETTPGSPDDVANFKP